MAFYIVEVDNDGFKVYNSSGILIDPATEATLAAIKDTDGIKKIIDALPAGNNALGLVKVHDGTNTANVIDDSGVGRLAIDIAKPATPSNSNVALSTSSTTLLAANSNRLGAAIFNDSNKSLYVKLGASASSTSFTVEVPKAGYYEVPFGYTGIIDGALSKGTGTARVTELT